LIAIEFVSSVFCLPLYVYVGAILNNRPIEWHAILKNTPRIWAVCTLFTGICYIKWHAIIGLLFMLIFTVRLFEALLGSTPFSPCMGAYRFHLDR
jgi:hypothetical protein